MPFHSKIAWFMWWGLMDRKPWRRRADNGTARYLDYYIGDIKPSMFGRVMYRHHEKIGLKPFSDWSHLDDRKDCKKGWKT